jgi:hypothetical protein
MILKNSPLVEEFETKEAVAVWAVDGFYIGGSL